MRNSNLDVPPLLCCMEIQPPIAVLSPQTTQEQCGEVEQELEATQRSLTGARQEGDALREANRELRSVRERLETGLRAEQEQSSNIAAQFRAVSLSLLSSLLVHSLVPRLHSAAFFCTV